MIDYVEWLRIFIFDHRSVEYIIIFLGAALGGELILLPLAFLSAQGIFSVLSLFILSFLGTMSSDFVWFLLGRTSTTRKIILHRYAENTISVLTGALERISKGSRLFSLILVKFIFGTRILFLVYVGKTGLPLKRFTFYNAIAVLLWLLVVIPVGFVSGLGLSYLAGIFNNLYVDLGLILFAVFVVMVVQIWLEKIFAQKASGVKLPEL